MGLKRDDKPVSQKVYEKLKRDIISNKLEPGEKLIELDIAKEYMVSRTPVRESLRQLEQEGLVTYFPMRGSIVSEISIEDALEFYEVREYLEGLAIKLICLNISRKEIRELEELIDKMAESTDRKDFVSLYDLHSLWTDKIIELTSNKFLKSQMISIYQNLARLRKISLYSNDHLMEAFLETRDIYESIVDGDEVKSEELARKHVINAKKRFLENINCKKNQ